MNRLMRGLARLVVWEGSLLSQSIDVWRATVRCRVRINLLSHGGVFGCAVIFGSCAWSGLHWSSNPHAVLRTDREISFDQIGSRDGGRNHDGTDQDQCGAQIQKCVITC
jgi:hypothetical protein